MIYPHRRPDPAKMQPRVEKVAYTLMPRKAVAATCEICQRDTRGWVVTKENIIVCRGCSG